MNDIHPPTSPTENKGSLGAGIALAWAIAVVGTAVCMTVSAALITRFNGFTAVLWLLPYIAIIAFAIWSHSKGKTRTGLGLMLGLVSMIAVALLLVAACFGMLHNFHGD